MGSIAAAVHPIVQVFQFLFLFEIFSVTLPRHAIDPGRRKALTPVCLTTSLRCQAKTSSSWANVSFPRAAALILIKAGHLKNEDTFHNGLICGLRSAG
jgi:hypothetical protein